MIFGFLSNFYFRQQRSIKPINNLHRIGQGSIRLRIRQEGQATAKSLLMNKTTSRQASKTRIDKTLLMNKQLLDKTLLMCRVSGQVTTNVTRQSCCALGAWS
ncbi:unnamed protein product (mitochondrion) [Musa textilis]